MYRRFSALLIPLALAGCATASRGSADEGLRASVAHGQDGVRVSLSEPAYVALFHVDADERVSLSYPAVGSDRSHVAAGRSTVLSGLRHLKLFHDVTSGPGAPRVYMVASRQPLDEARIREIQSGQVSLPSGLSLARDPREAIAYLASLVVPAETPETDWDADVVSMARFSGRYVAGGGSIPVMPPEKGATDCFGHSEPQAVCDSPARDERAGFGGHRVDDNVNPPPGAHKD
jgi:hypothetical protein